MPAAAYKADGVNLSAGDAFSKFAGHVARTTWTCSPHVLMHDLSEGNFRGPRGYTFRKLPKGCINTVTADGVGTKVSLHAASVMPEEAGHDLLAMTAGDISRFGGKALIFANVLDVASLGEPDSEEFDFFQLLMSGLVNAARKNCIVVATGETAELGPCVGSDNTDSKVKFNWAGTAIGVYHKDLMITGATMQPGHLIVALKEDGFRSNGISSVRKAFKLRFGERWWSHPDAKPYLRLASRRSTIYDSFLATVNGWNGKRHKLPISMISHITGGGIPEKFGKPLIEHGFSAYLENLFDPPEIMSTCADWRGDQDGKKLTEDDFYRTWNGGQGLLAVMPEVAVSRFIELANQHRITAKVCGIITSGRSPMLTLNGKWRHQTCVYGADNL